MLKLMQKTLYSKRLKDFIEKHKVEELKSIKDLLVNLYRTGMIDYCGPTSILKENGRSGAMFDIELAIMKLEFVSEEEVYEYLKLTFAPEWHFLISELEKKHNNLEDMTIEPLSIDSLEKVSLNQLES
jgi:hypothetical protein